MREYLGVEWELFLSCAIDLICVSQSKRLAVFCSYLSAMDIRVLKTFANHMYSAISVESHDAL